MGYRNHNPRHPSDDYQTGLKLAKAICQRMAQFLPPPLRMIEPSAGLGRFVIASKEQWPNAHMTALDIREECLVPLKNAGADSVLIESWEDDLPEFKEPFDLIIGNPPYYRAEEHIHLAKKRLRQGGHLAFLLRMAFLSSQKRVKTLWQPPSELRYLMPLAQRASFTDDGKTEHSEYAMYIWQRGYDGNPELLPHVWE
jgi:hypothetical protein